ncbi:hypothetical protein EB795_29970 [Pseudomonas mandelii]|uniref:hypothetical protein n=1 Tax=Pseudomonas mandelii TaxID=75612 RepID=UPI0012B2551A|nr:hypothetical protein [Pseudomonas mandelii]MSU98102.1 hypothetical protein [Pseudomonas mandelii]
MNKSALQAYVEGEINLAAKRIIDKGPQSDEIAYGRLKVNLSLRRILVEAPTPEDLGLWGGINDILQQLGILDSRETVLSVVDEV